MSSSSSNHHHDNNNNNNTHDHDMMKHDDNDNHHALDEDHQPSSLSSPSHLSSLPGGLSPEDIQELLGGVLEDHPEHGQDQEEASSSDRKSVV